ncbi:MAG: serine protease [Anaerolineales bacterium]|nr:MAG: serine protease [Anaerolineales bacterium]
MISKAIYERIRNGVCAVGHLTTPLTVYRENLDKPIFQVVGTGFLIEENLVLTNRHIVKDLIESTSSGEVPPSQLFIQFVVPHEGSHLELVPRMIREVSYVDDPKLDLGFIKYKTVTEAHFASILPLDIADQWESSVSEEVAVCGYPYGTSILIRGIYLRWGPVVQQGHISAVSPFDTTTMPDELLLDVRRAGGMSGAPIFKPGTGTVIGVHYSGIEGTIAFGVPITRAIVNHAMLQYDRNRVVLNEG